MENEVKNDTSIEMEKNNSNNTPQKKSGLAKIIIIIVAVLLVAGGITFAVISFSSKEKPKTVSKEIDKVAVYSNAISSTFGKINKLVDDIDSAQGKFQIGDKPLYFTGDIKIDSNFDELKDIDLDLSKYKLDLAFGVDSKNKLIQLNAGLNDTLKAQLYYKNNRVYLISDVLDNPVDVTKEVKDALEINSFEEISSAFTEVNEVQKLEIDDKLKNMTAVFEQIITEVIEEQKIESQESSYEVNGEKVEATKLTVTIDEETIKKVVTKLEKDEEFISVLASMTDLSERETKEILEEMINSDTYFDEKIFISIYVQKDSENATGLSFKVGSEEFLSFYTYNDSFILTMSGDGEKIVIQTEKKNNGTAFALKINSEELLSGVIRELSDKKIDCDITLNNEGDKFDISIYTTVNEKESSISGEYKYKMSKDGKYIGVSGKYSLESKDSLGNIDVSNATLPDSVDSNKLLTNIQNKIASNADLKTLFELLFS